MSAFLRSHIRFLGSFGLGAASGLDLILTRQDQINQLIGAVIILATVVGGFIHDLEIKRAELEAKSKTLVVAP